MKRKSLFLISTLTLLGGLVSPPKTYADVVYDGVSYYTVPDILAIGEEIEALKIAECGEDYDYECGREVADRLMFESGEQRYMAYDLVQHSHLIFSSINPNLNTMTIHYRDEDDEMFRWTGIKERYDMKELYLYWLDPAIDTDYTHILQGHINSIKDGTYNPELVHVLFAGYSAADFEWLTPNVDSTIPLSSEAGYSKTQPIHFHAVTNGNSYGNVDIRECLNSDNYEDGLDCVKIIDKIDASWRFIPMLPQSEPQEPDAEDTDVTDEPEETEGSDAPEETTEPETPEELDKPEISEEPADEPEKTDEESKEPEVPEIPESPESPETPEMPEPLEEPEDLDEPKDSGKPEDISGSEEFEPIEEEPEVIEESEVVEEKPEVAEEESEVVEKEPEIVDEKTEVLEEDLKSTEEKDELTQESDKPAQETNPIKEKEPELVQESVGPEMAPFADIITVAASVVKTNSAPIDDITEKTIASSGLTVKAQDNLELPISNTSNNNDTALVEGEKDGFPWWLVVTVTAAIFLIIWFIVPAKKRKKQ